MAKIFTYEEVETYRNSIEEEITACLKSLEDKIIKGRDDPEQKIPVYLTKWRVKSIKSIYLKTKKDTKYDSLDQITDHGGLRILFLFEQDIAKSTEFLFNTISSVAKDILEVLFFNWDDTSEVKKIETLVTNKHPNAIINPTAKGKSLAYKSIHYVIRINNRKGNSTLPIEIQIRTLLQDVWGELDHALVYKHGNINPHIQKSFHLLARDLRTADMLMTHLRNISDKEKDIRAFQVRDLGPYRVFWYEKNLIPNIFKTNSALKAKFHAYKIHVKPSRYECDLDKWIEKARSLYDTIDDEINKLQKKERKNFEVKYWKSAEDAFLEFVSGDLKNALVKYEKIIEMLKENKKEDVFYVPYFRIGEIHFMNGDIEKALGKFDKCEEVLSKQDENIRDHLNAYTVNVKLANTYWLLGSDYIGLAIKEILAAERIFNKHGKSFPDEGYLLTLTNNICWYFLEKYTITNKEKDYKDAFKRYEDLKKLLNKGQSNINALDTAMWFCYKTFCKTNDREYLEKAKDYYMDGKKVLPISSYSEMRMSHVQEIMSIE